MAWFLHKSYTLLSDLVWLLCCLWAAGMSTYLTLLVLLGTLATKATGGRRAGLRRLQTLTTSTLIPRSTRRTRVIVTSVAPSAGFCRGGVPILQIYDTI